MSARTHEKILEIIRTDRTFERAESRGRDVWVGKCLHCNAHLTVALDGTPISRATIEHIKPRGWGGTEELENLALACARCNHQKGRTHDKEPTPRGLELMEKLLARRRSRWRD